MTLASKALKTGISAAFKWQWDNLLPFCAYAMHGRKGNDWVTWHKPLLAVINPVLILRQTCITHNATLGQGE